MFYIFNHMRGFMFSAEGVGALSKVEGVLLKDDQKKQSVSRANRYTEIYAWRHGETDSNHEGLLTGAGADSEIAYLNDKGKDQAKELAEKVKKIVPDLAIIFSSPLQRANETAKYVQQGLKPQPRIEIRPQLSKIYHGEYELSKASIRNEAADRLFKKEIEKASGPFYFWQKHPLSNDKVNNDASIRNISSEFKMQSKKPETVFELYKRGLKELVEIAKMYPGKKIGVSSHGGFLATQIDALRFAGSDVVLPPFYASKSLGKMPEPVKVKNCALMHFRCDTKTSDLEYLGVLE